MRRHDLDRVAVQQHHQHFYTGTALKAFNLNYDYFRFDQILLDFFSFFF